MSNSQKMLVRNMLATILSIFMSSHFNPVHLIEIHENMSIFGGCCHIVTKEI